MKILKLIVLSIMTVGLLSSFAFAGDIAKGKALFNNARLSGATAGKSCNSCHADGEGIDVSKKEFMGDKAKSLEAAVNMCITMFMNGEALDTKSDDMANIVSYIKSVKDKDKDKASKKAPQKKKAIEGC